MMCELKRKNNMSGVNNINSSNVYFQGKKNTEEAKKGEKIKHAASKIGSIVTKPVRDSFTKKYGEGTKPNSKNVADFIGDTIVKVAFPLAVGAFALIKTRKIMNGFTKAFKQNASDLAKTTEEAAMKAQEEAKKAIKAAVVTAREEAEKAGKTGDELADAIRMAKSEAERVAQEGMPKPMSLVEKFKTLWHRTSLDVSINNAKAKEAAKAAAQTANGASDAIKTAPSLKDALRDAVFKPAQKFDESSNIAKQIDKHFADKPDVAKNMKDKLLKIGVYDDASIADLGASLGVSALAGTGAVNIADDATSADDFKFNETNKYFDLAIKAAEAFELLP